MERPQKNGWIDPKGVIIYFLLIVLIPWARSVWTLLTFLFFPDSSFAPIVIYSLLLLSACYILTQAKVKRTIVLSFPIICIFLAPLLECLMFSFGKPSCVYRSLISVEYYRHYITTLFIVYLVIFFLNLIHQRVRSIIKHR